MSDTDWNKMTVAQLKEACTSKSLPVTGKKSELVSRLEEHCKVATEGETEGDLLAETAGEEVAADEPIDDQILNDEDTNGDAEVKEETAEGEETAKTEGAEEEMDTKEETETEAKKVEEKKDTKKITLPEGVPELPTYAQIQEARIAETRMRTVIVYPMNIEDMSSEGLQTELSKSQHFMVKFVQDVEKKKKGFVEMHFNTRKDAREAASQLRDIKLSVGEHTVRQLEPDEAGTAYKSAVIDTIKPHLTHQIKKATGKDADSKVVIHNGHKIHLYDYDTRVVYVHNLPDNCTDEQLAEIFPEAKAILTSIDADEKNKGYAYLSFEQEEESEECIKKHEDLTIDENRVTLHMIRDLKIAAGIEARKPFRQRGRQGMKGKNMGGNNQGKGKMMMSPGGGRGRGRGGMSPRGGGMGGRGGRGGRGGNRGGWGGPMGGMGGNFGQRGGGGHFGSPRGGQVRPLMGPGPNQPRPLMGGQGGQRGYQNQGRGGGQPNRRGGRGGGGNKNQQLAGVHYIDFHNQGGNRKRKAEGYGGYGGGQQYWNKMPRQMGGGNMGGYRGGNYNQW